MKIVSYILALLCLVSCTDKLEPAFQEYSLELKLSIPQNALEEIDSLSPIDVTFYNTNKDYSFTKTSDDEGMLSLDALESGIYNLQVSQDFPEEGLTVILNGDTTINLVENIKDSLQLKAVFVQEAGAGFVIKECYYGGSTTIFQKKYITDQFIDIYNNGTDTLSTEKLLLVELSSYGTGPNYWSHIQEDSIVVKTIWAFPNDIENNTVAPGQGIVIACDAMAHKSDSIYGNPNSPVDLDNADFEFWSDKSESGDIDFQAPNMVDKLWTYKANEFNLHTRGGSAIALVMIPTDCDDYIQNNLVTEGTATSSSRYFCKIPNEWVIDAVECIQKDKIYKRFDESLDAGYTYLEASYKGLSVRRQVKRTINGRTIYKDTNNSRVDFIRDASPQPGLYE